MERFRYSELIDTILKHFALKMVGRSHGKALAINVGKNMVSGIFFFVVEMYERSDFWMQKFFLTGVIFWSLFPHIMDQKMTPAKKFYIMKNQFFRARQPREEISAFRSPQHYILMLLCQNFDSAAPYHF